MNEIPDPGIFRSAADVIRENGLNKGEFSARFRHTDSPLACCTAGALQLIASGVPDLASKEADAAMLWLLEKALPDVSMDTAIHDQPGGLAEPIALWNDAPERTADEVIAAFERAAVAAEAERAEVMAWTQTDLTRWEHAVDGVVWVLEQKRQRVPDLLFAEQPNDWYLSGPNCDDDPMGPYVVSAQRHANESIAAWAAAEAARAAQDGGGAA